MGRSRLGGVVGSVMNRARTWCALFVTTIVAPMMAQSSDTPTNWYYTYYKRPQLLTLDVTRLAIQPKSNVETPAFEGLSGDEDVSLPIAGWRVAKTVDSHQSNDRILQMVATAASSPGVSFVSPVFRGASGGSMVVLPELIVGFAENVDGQTAQALLDQVGAGEVIARHWSGMNNVYRLRSAERNGFDVLAAANRLAESDQVLFAEPNMLFTGRGGLIPSDPLFSLSWGLHNTGQSNGGVDIDMDGPEAWDITLGNPSQVVVVIDTGVDPLHPDLNLIPGYDATDDGPGDGSPFNIYDNHGTPVAGCVSGKINNWTGSLGIAPNCKVGSARTFRTVTSQGEWVTQSSWTVDALGWAESIGTRITNNSNAYDFATAAIGTKYAQTRANGMIHFASVHNDGEEIITYPALLPSVNAVAAVDRFGQRPWFGNFGPGVDFSAPGEEILSTDRSGLNGYVTNDYLIGSGTSFASPYAAGIAALILSRNPALSAQTVERILNDSCMDLGETGYDLEFGWGMVNAAAALALADPAATGACCVAGQCQDGVTSETCESQGGDQPDGRWFGGQSCSAVECPPTNTRCDAAAPIIDNGEFTFDNSSFTNLPSPEYSCGLGGFHDGTLWFRFTATQTSVRIHTCNSAMADSTFALFDSCGLKMELGCGEDDERCAASPYLSDQCIAGLTPGVEYFLQFSAWSSGDRGSYTVSLQAPCPPPAPLPESNKIPANRSIALWVPPTPSTADAAPTSTSAIIVTLLDLQNPSPPNPPAHPAPNFAAYENGQDCNDPSGCLRWVGEPYDYPEFQSGSTTFKAARLQCTPYYHNWVAEGVVRIVGAEILPSSTYDVQLVPVECAGFESECLSISAALRLTTSRFGDVAFPYSPPSAAFQPDALDITALVDRFRGIPTAPPKARALIHPNAIDLYRAVDAIDIVSCVDAFRGFAYSFHGPCPCPSTVTCGATDCTIPSNCPGGTCVRTCQGGEKDENPCTDDPQCPGGTCGPGFCRDMCQRCSP